MTARRLPGAVHEEAGEPDGHAGEVLRLFEAKAATWPAKYAPDGPLAGRLASLSAAVSRYAQAGDRVLDLGCGTGELTRALAADGLRVAGCDISRQMLLRAPRDRGGCAGWVQLEPGWRRLPFASAAFDVVVAASVLEYVAEPAAVLRECARVLRPGGVVLYTVPDLRHPVRWAEWCAQRLARCDGGAVWGRPPVAMEGVPRLPAGVAAASSRPVVAGGFPAGWPAPGAVPGGRGPVPAPAAGVLLR